MNAMDWLGLASGVTIPPVSALGIHLLLRGPLRAFFGAWLGCSAGGGVLALADGDTSYSAGCAISVVICVAAWWWWHRRQRRRDALGWLGYKARAALATLVQRAREAAQPRPIRHPVPQGAAA